MAIWGGGKTGAPELAGDGNVYVVDSKGALYAVDAATGAPKWTYPHATMASDTFTAGGDKVYFAFGQTITAISAAGK